MRSNDIKIHVKKLQELVEVERKKARKTKMRFVALSEEEIIAKLTRANTPFIFAWLYPPSVSPGGTFGSTHWVYNPDPVTQSNLYGWGFVGVYWGNDFVIDTRFPRLAQPKYPGLSLPANGGAGVLLFYANIPAQIDVGTYFLNTFLHQQQQFSHTTYLASLDNDMIVFEIK